MGRVTFVRRRVLEHQFATVPKNEMSRFRTEHTNDLETVSGVTSNRRLLLFVA